MKVTKEMPSPPPAGDDELLLNSRGLTREPLMSIGMRARMAIMRMSMRRKMNRTPMTDQRRM